MATDAEVLALDRAGVRAGLAAGYSRIGRPSVDPEVLLRLLLVGYLYGMRSERRLVDGVRVNVAYRWFARLPFGAAVPHHSTCSKNRHTRFGPGVFRAVFEAVVRQCIAAGLVTGDACSVGGSMVESPRAAERFLLAAAAQNLRRLAAHPLPAGTSRGALGSADGRADPQQAPARVDYVELAQAVRRVAVVPKAGDSLRRRPVRRQRRRERRAPVVERRQVC